MRCCWGQDTRATRIAQPASQSLQRSDLVTLEHIKEQSRLSLGSYGQPRMTEELKKISLNVGQANASMVVIQLDDIATSDAFARLA